jgi:hypothetical protein
MTPAELKQLSIRHLQGLLGRTVDPLERAKIERILVEERDKPDSAYPVSTGERR